MVNLICGNSSYWRGSGVDLVLTNPYAPLPICLRDTPMILTDFAERKRQCEHYAGGELEEIGAWSKDGRCRVWVRNMMPFPIRTNDLFEEEIEPGKGFFPLELPMRLLEAYGYQGMTVWDGFMGRGTVGKACQQLGMKYIGIDLDPKRVEMARAYLA